jgi:hypothetical protein
MHRIAACLRADSRSVAHVLADDCSDRRGRVGAMQAILREYLA